MPAKFIAIIRINTKGPLPEAQRGDLIDIAPWPRNWDGKSEFWRESGKIHLFIPLDEDLLTMAERSEYRRTAVRKTGEFHPQDPDDIHPPRPITAVTKKHKYQVNWAMFAFQPEELKKLEDETIYYQPLIERGFKIKKVAIEENPLVLDDSREL